MLRGWNWLGARERGIGIRSGKYIRVRKIPGLVRASGDYGIFMRGNGSQGICNGELGVENMYDSY